MRLLKGTHNHFLFFLPRRDGLSGWLLEHFFTGIVIDRNRLLGESLDYLMAEGSERTIDTHIKNLRAKLGNNGWIETVRGFGYRFSGKPV